MYGSGERRYSVSLSMTKSEKEIMTAMAKAYGLSLSAYVRMAAFEYDVTHRRIADRLSRSEDEPDKKSDTPGL